MGQKDPKRGKGRLLSSNLKCLKLDFAPHKGTGVATLVVITAFAKAEPTTIIH